MTGVQTCALPILTNKTLSEAKKSLASIGLSIGTTSSESSSTIEEGKIISQSVKANEMVVESTMIDIVISTGPEETTAEDTETAESTGSSETTQNVETTNDG